MTLQLLEVTLCSLAHGPSFIFKVGHQITLTSASIVIFASLPTKFLFYCLCPLFPQQLALYFFWRSLVCSLFIMYVYVRGGCGERERRVPIFPVVSCKRGGRDLLFYFFGWSLDPLCREELCSPAHFLRSLCSMWVSAMRV